MRRFSFLIVLFVIVFSTPASTYVTQGIKWPEARTVFHVDIPGADGLWDDAFETAMFRWNDSTNFEFRLVRDSYGNPCRDPNVNAAKNGVAFSDSICGTDWSEEIAISITWVITNTNEIVQSGVLFNRYEDWGVYSGPWWEDPYFGINDFRRVAVHELGHCLGLSHENSVPAIMQSLAGDIEYPTADDIAGVTFLYPVPAVSPPGPSSDSPKDIQREGVSSDVGGGGSDVGFVPTGGGGGGGACFITASADKASMPAKIPALILVLGAGIIGMAGLKKKAGESTTILARGRGDMDFSAGRIACPVKHEIHSRRTTEHGLLSTDNSH
jgi:hypothetical protein